MSVTYKVAKIPALDSGETGYALSDGSYAAIRFAPGEGAAPDMFSIKATARAVAKDGAPVLDHKKAPVCCCKHVSAPKSSLVTGQSSGASIKEQVIEKVINDPDGLVAELAAVQAFIQLFPTFTITPTGAKP